MNSAYRTMSDRSMPANQVRKLSGVNSFVRRVPIRLRHVTEAIEALGIPASVFFNDAIGSISTFAADRFIALVDLHCSAQRGFVDLRVCHEITESIVSRLARMDRVVPVAMSLPTVFLTALSAAKGMCTSPARCRCPYINNRPSLPPKSSSYFVTSPRACHEITESIASRFARVDRVVPVAMERVSF